MFEEVFEPITKAQGAFYFSISFEMFHRGNFRK